MRKFFVPAAILIFTIVGCQQEAAPGKVAAAKRAQSSVQGTVSATFNPALTIQPSTIATCDSGVVATVGWDAQAAHVTTTATQIWVGSNATDLKLFTAGGSKGRTQTGPWTHPGSHFVLKNKDDGKVLADVTVGGPKCP
jgi:hypothetical protein